MAIGLRMGDLFAVAKAHRDLPLAELELLLDHVAYEPRMAAFCILDFKAQRRLTEDQRRELYEIYLRRHDRITAWDMVDRAAPRVVGGYLAGRDLEPLHQLARAVTRCVAGRRSPRRCSSPGPAATPTWPAASRSPPARRRSGTGGAQRGRDLPQTRRRPRRRRPLHRFLGEHAATMPRPALRLAIEKLSPAERTRYRRALSLRELRHNRGVADQPAVRTRVGTRELTLDQSGQGALPQRRVHQGRGDRLLLSDRRHAAALRRRPAADPGAVPRRRRLRPASTRRTPRWARRPGYAPRWSTPPTA